MDHAHTPFSFGEISEKSRKLENVVTTFSKQEMTLTLFITFKRNTNFHFIS